MADAEGMLISNLIERVIDIKTDDDHFKAVQAQSQFVNQVYIGILQMVISENGVCAESLLRTLFESAVNCVILAKHKEKLNDFIRAGQFAHLRMLRFSTLPDPFKKRFDEIIKMTEADWKPLFDEFQNCDWHKLKTRDSFIEAGHKPNVYDEYYRRASAYSHGEPYTVVLKTDNTWKKWTVEAQPDRWKKIAAGTRVFGSLAVLHMLAIINVEFRLSIDEELRNLGKQVSDWREKHVEAVKQAFEESLA